MSRKDWTVCELETDANYWRERENTCRAATNMSPGLWLRYANEARDKAKASEQELTKRYNSAS